MAFKNLFLFVMVSIMMMFDVDQFVSHSQRFSMISTSDDSDDVEVERSSFVKKASHLTSTQTLSSPNSSCYFINSLSIAVTLQDPKKCPPKFVIFLDLNRSVYSSQSLSPDI